MLLKIDVVHVGRLQGLRPATETRSYEIGNIIFVKYETYLLTIASQLTITCQCVTQYDSFFIKAVTEINKC